MDSEPMSSSPQGSPPELGSYNRPTRLTIGVASAQQETTVAGPLAYPTMSFAQPPKLSPMSIPPTFLTGSALTGLEAPTDPTGGSDGLSVPTATAGPVAISDILSGGSGGNSLAEEEADMYTYARMLQDPRGRLCKSFSIVFQQARRSQSYAVTSLSWLRRADVFKIQCTLETQLLYHVCN
jgi:hypothetical protein